MGLTSMMSQFPSSLCAKLIFEVQTLHGLHPYSRPGSLGALAASVAECSSVKPRIQDKQNGGQAFGKTSSQQYYGSNFFLHIYPGYMHRQAIAKCLMSMSPNAVKTPNRRYTVIKTNTSDIATKVRILHVPYFKYDFIQVKIIRECGLHGSVLFI